MGLTATEASFAERQAVLREEQRKLRREREHAVLQMRLAGKSMREIGEAMGFSASRASQIYCRALHFLHRPGI
jgi:DNA-directed RNA polymerase specialized sigma subunit